MKALNFLKKWEFGLVLILFILIGGLGLINPDLLNITRLLYSVNDFVYIGIAAIFMTFVIITGGIDVSVGAIMGLTSIVIGLLWKGGMNIWLTLPIGMLVGVLCGALNGLLVAFANIQAMVVTLGGMFLYSGIALVLSGGSDASGYEGISGLPDAFVNVANGNTSIFPNPVLILIALTIILYVVLHRTIYGKNVFLCGINSRTAKYSGLRNRWTIMSTYMLSGFGASIGGIILTSYFSSARSDLGYDATLPVITAVVLGGTSITGGKGGVVGSVIASVLIGLLQFGLQMIDFSSQQSNVAIGLILIIAVAINKIDFNKIKAKLNSGKTSNNVKKAI